MNWTGQKKEKSSAKLYYTLSHYEYLDCHKQALKEKKLDNVGAAFINLKKLTKIGLIWILDKLQFFLIFSRYTVGTFSKDFSAIWKSLPEKFNNTTVFCAQQFGTDFGTCNGDSGGPMVQDDGVAVTLIAIVHGAITSCDGSRYPSIFTRINHPSILNWIYKTVGFLDKYFGKYFITYKSS